MKKANKNNLEEFEITFYLDEEQKIELDNPSGVIGASCLFDSEMHCTYDVRMSMYSENVTLVFSDITKDGRSIKSLNDCVSIGVYQKEVHKVKCHVQRTHYNYLVIKKNDLELWNKKK